MSSEKAKFIGRTLRMPFALLTVWMDLKWIQRGHRTSDDVWMLLSREI